MKHLTAPRLAVRRASSAVLILLCATTCSSTPRMDREERTWERQMELALRAAEAQEPRAAMPRLLNALEIVRSDPAPKLIQLAYTSWHIGELCFTHPELAREGQAEEMLRISLRSFQEVYGPEHPVVIPVLLLLGEVRAEQGDLEASQALVDEADRITARSFPESHFLRQSGSVRHASALYPEEMFRLLAELDTLGP